MALNPLSERIPVTIFANLAGKRLRTEETCLRELSKLFKDTEAPEKDKLPLIKLATFGKKTSDKGSLRTDENLIEISGLEGDYDAEKMDPEDATELLEKAGIAAIVCTTTSHRPNAPRWRVFCPLSREYKPAERYELLARLNGVLGGVLGAESFKPSQCYYFGNITDARPLKFFEVDGDYIDLIDHLKDGALGASGVHPDDEGDEDDEEHESTDLDEAQELYERDLESGKLEEALEFALSVQHEQGRDADKEEDRNHWWRNVCWAIHHGSGGSKDGFKLWRDYARRTYRAERLKARNDSVESAIRDEWSYAKNHRNGGVLGFGSVYKNLRDLGWGDISGAIREEFEAEDDNEVEAADQKESRVKPSRLKAPAKELPKHLQRVPGKLQLAVDWYNATAPKSQPHFAVQTALALGSVVLGRHHVTDNRNYSALYFLCLGETGCGKEHIKTALETFLDDANRTELLGPKGYTSEGAVISALLNKPRHLSIQDEFGQYLKAARGSGNANSADVQSSYIELFARVSGTHIPKQYSTMGMAGEQAEAANNRKIVRPSLTVIGMTTPAVFYEALSSTDVSSGFLNRLLIIKTPIGRQKMRRGIDFELAVPKELRRWIQSHSYPTGGKQDDDDEDDIFIPEDKPLEVPPPEKLKFSDEAWNLFDQYEDSVLAKQDQLDEQGMADLMNRTLEIAMRLSLIVALSCEARRVEGSHVRWAIDYVEFCHGTMADEFADNLGITEAERITEQVYRFIVKVGGRVPEWKVSSGVRNYRKLDPRQTDEIAARLKRDFGVSLKIGAGRGPKGKFFEL